METTDLPESAKVRSRKTKKTNKNSSASASITHIADLQKDKSSPSQLTVSTAETSSLIEFVEGSPKAVAIHDKLTWLNLFASFSVVEDPIGSSPTISGLFDHKSGRKGNGPLARFFDTFIAPNQIKFLVERDIVCGLTVVRDLTVEITMQNNVVVYVPMHLVYQLTHENDQLKIAHLAAHWELVPMVMQVLKAGVPGYKVMLALGLRMIKLQGLSGVAGFSTAVRCIGDHGKQTAGALIAAINTKNVGRLLAQFAKNHEGVEFPVAGKTIQPEELLNEKNLNIKTSKFLSAGYVTSFSFSMEKDGKIHDGVAFAEFDRKTKKVQKLKFCWNA